MTSEDGGSKDKDPPRRNAGQEYYRRKKQTELEQAQKEYDRLSTRLWHGKRLILEAWQDEARPLEEVEVWEDLWIALWRKRRRLSRTIVALGKELAELEGDNNPDGHHHQQP